MSNQHNGFYDGRYIDTTATPLFKTFKEMKAVLQDRLPPAPRPKDIKHVVLDADDTIWDIEPWGIASMSRPVGKTDKDSLAIELLTEYLLEIPKDWGDARPTGVISLDPTLRDTIQKLKAKGIPVSIASCNTKSSILRYLEAFGLTDEFTDVEADLWHSKSHMIQSIADRQKIDTAQVLFVNDSYDNAFDVSINTQATALIKGFNIGTIEDILEFIR